MNKTEIIEALAAGKIVTHMYFDSHEFVKLNEHGLMEFEDGCTIDQETFWNDRKGSHWDTDWDIFKPKQEPTTTGTKMFECTECGWIGCHENKIKRNDGSWATDVCPECGQESFYTSEIKAKPCDICKDDVLVLERVGEPLDGILCGKCYTSMTNDDDDENEFEHCDDCDGHGACEDFGCAVKLGLSNMLEPPL